MSRFRLSPQALLVREQVLRNRCGTYFSHRHYAGRVATPIIPTDQSAERWPNRRKLTREEKDKMEAMLAEDHCWDSIANALPGRTQRTLTDHYRDYMFTPGELIKARPSAENTTLPETHWSLKGDRKILDMLAENQSWRMIAEALPGRNARSIQRRYNQGLCKPGKSTCRDADAKTPAIHSKLSSAEHSQKPSDRRSPLDGQTRRSFATVNCWATWNRDRLPAVVSRSWSRRRVWFTLFQGQRRFESTTIASDSRSKRGPKPHVYTEEQDARIVDLRADGLGLDHTALLVGMKYTAVRFRWKTLMSQEKWIRRYEARKSPLSCKARKFTFQEDAEIIRMRKAGTVFREIGSVLERSTSSVATRYYALARGGDATRRAPPRGQKASTNLHADEQIESMRKMKMAGASIKEMAMKLDFTQQLVKSLLRHYCGSQPPRQQPWTESEVEILLSATGGERDFTKLTPMLPGRSKDEIRLELWRRGVVYHRTWTAAEDEEVLRLNASGLKHKEIALRIGRTTRGCRQRLSHVKLRLALAESQVSKEAVRDDPSH